MIGKSLLGYKLPFPLSGMRLLLLVWFFYKFCGILKQINAAISMVQESHPEYEIRFKPRSPCGINYGVVEIYRTY